VSTQGRHYRCQNGCYNCRHAFRRREHEEQNTFFCTIGAGLRPPCMSGAMHEYASSGGVDAHRAWDAWSDGREVVAWGICDDWEVAT